MEDVLNVYHRPYDPQRPQVCFDEGTKQLVKHVTDPIPASPGQPEIIDYEYERNGTGNLFMLSEPLTGRRKVRVTERRTAIDYAHAIKYLVDEMYPEADMIVLVHDNLNTHKPASLYAAFPQRKPAVYSTNWRSTTPPNTAAGSGCSVNTVPRSNWAC